VNLGQSITWLPFPRTTSIRLDTTVLLFTVAVSIFVGLLFGLAPALQASRVNLVESLKESARGVTGSAGWRGRLQDGLVVAEIATSLALLVGAGLLLRSFARMRTADIGVHTDNILTMAVVLPDTKYKAFSARRAFYDQLLARVQSLPGIEIAALAQTLPLEGDHSWAGYPEGASDWRASLVQLRVNFITPDYFRLMGIPFYAGGNFTPREFDRALAVSEKFDDFTKKNPAFHFGEHREFLCSAILSRSAAQGLWPNQNPIGKVFVSGNIPVQVVGVVGDVKETGIRDAAAATPQAYFPVTQELDSWFYPEEIIVKTRSVPTGAISAIRASVQQLDGSLSTFRVRTLQQVVGESMEDTSLQTSLLGAFAGLAVLLAAVGVYGVMSYLVSQRAHEIGIRVALGARRGDILRLVLGHSARLALAGAVLGLLLAFALTRLIAKPLYGVGATDPRTFAVVSLLLFGVALAACYIPARRAMRTDLMVALRYE
jgi:predicted permease